MGKMNGDSGAAISERFIESVAEFLYVSGALDDPTLVIYDGFVHQMLEETIERCGEQWGPVTEVMKEKAVHFFLNNLDPNDPAYMTAPHFIHDMLHHVLIGGAPVTDDGSGETLH